MLAQRYQKKMLKCNEACRSSEISVDLIINYSLFVDL